MNIEPIELKQPKKGRGLKPVTDEQEGAAIKAAIKEAKESIRKTGEAQHSLFPLEAFPERLQDIVNTFYETYQLPIDFHCASILAAASVAIGNAYAARYKSREIYPLIMWVCIVGPPGIGKTPAMRWGMYPIYNIERRFRKRYNESMAIWQQKCDTARNNGGDLPAEPKSKDIVVKDSTVESMNQILEANPKGIILDQDELLAWVKNMNSYRKGSDLEYFLSVWSGSPVKVTRTGKATKWIEYPFLDVLGSIQPKMLKDLISNDKANNGFLDRILFAYPDEFHVPEETDIDVHESVYNTYDNIIQFLHRLPNLFNQYTDEVTGEEVTEIIRLNVPLTAQARKIYKEYRNNLGEEQNNADEEAVMGLLSKTKQYCLRIALILELLDLACRALPPEGKGGEPEEITLDFARTIEISEKSINRAILVSEYFKRTSLKVLDQLDGPVNQLPRYQKEWYKHLPETFTRQEAMDLALEIKNEAPKARISERTISRLLNPKDGRIQLFRKVGAEYQKLYV